MGFIDNIHRVIKKSEFYLHETKRSTIKRFLLLILIVIVYFSFVSYRYGAKGGFQLTVLTWSFFVLCTPIADAGFLLDFPIRLITKLRMLYSESIVWVIAFAINGYMLAFNSQIYEINALMNLFMHILLTPFPYWAIIIVSGLGTFLSIHFADELMDVAKHEHREIYNQHKLKHQLLILIFLIILIVILYDFLLNEFGINIL